MGYTVTKMTVNKAILILEKRIKCNKQEKEEAKQMAIKALEQGSKTGHWILAQRDRYIDISCSECGNIRFKDYAYGYTIDELDLDEVNDLLAKIRMNYCECCGAKMSEILTGSESNRTCHTCKHYTSGEHDGSCGSYICKGYSNWESE